MITELYTFSPGSFVVADEWNANFVTLYNINLAHSESITDAYTSIAFPDSDLSLIFNAVKRDPNSKAIFGSSITIAVECEYYKSLSSSEKIQITIPSNMNGESRVLIYIPNTRSDFPFNIIYSGTTIINYGYYDYKKFRAGYYYIMIYESNGLAQIKIIWTGV